jgi:hypothetical protein
MKQFPIERILCEGHEEMAEVLPQVLKADVQECLYCGCPTVKHLPLTGYKFIAELLDAYYIFG